MQVRKDIAGSMFQYLCLMLYGSGSVYTVCVDLHGGVGDILSSVYIQWRVSWWPVINSSHVSPVNCPSSSLRMACSVWAHPVGDRDWLRHTHTATRRGRQASLYDQSNIAIIFIQTQHLLCVSCYYTEKLCMWSMFNGQIKEGPGLVGLYNSNEYMSTKINTSAS